jgi:hypothetical protein
MARRPFCAGVRGVYDCQRHFAPPNTNDVVTSRRGFAADEVIG